MCKQYDAAVQNIPGYSYLLVLLFTFKRSRGSESVRQSSSL